MRPIFATDLKNLDDFNQAQKEAAIDLLLLVMYADKIVAQQETACLDEFIGESSWEGDVNAATYIAQMRVTVIHMLEADKGVATFVADARKRINDDAKTQDIYFVVKKMANADQHMDQREMDILNLLMDNLS